MMLLPCGPGVCPICAVKHEDDQPHNQQSLYYQMRFYGVRGRWPTWADAVAHCTPEVRRLWREEIDKMFPGKWSEPEDGQPIADPPSESTRQPVGDIDSPTFGPEEEEEP